MAAADFARESPAGAMHLGGSPDADTASPIDSIAVKMAAGYNLMHPQAWQAMSRQERFDLVKAQRVVFLSNDVSVSARAALRWLAANVREDAQ